MSDYDRSPVPALASMTLPKVAALVLDHIKTTHPPLPVWPVKDTSLASSLAAVTPALVCSDPGAGDDWPLVDVCSGCGEEFSVELRGPYGCRNCQS